MKISFFMGRNPDTRSGVSWKIWKITRSGKRVTTYWGPAKLEKRRVVPCSYMRELVRQFKTITEAKACEKRLVDSKIRKGYEPRPRWRWVLAHC